MKHRRRILFFKLAIEFLASGTLYILVETVFRLIRRHKMTNPLVILLGGGAFLIGIGICRIPVPRRWMNALKPLLGGLLITVWELLFGLFFNVCLGLDIWNYMGCGYELFGGQICLKFSLTWIGVTLGIMLLDWFLERKLLSGTRYSFEALSRKN